jgi:hypothetical protein
VVERKGTEDPGEPLRMNRNVIHPVDPVVAWNAQVAEIGSVVEFAVGVHAESAIEFTALKPDQPSPTPVFLE